MIKKILLIIVVIGIISFPSIGISGGNTSHEHKKQKLITMLKGCYEVGKTSDIIGSYRHCNEMVSEMANHITTETELAIVKLCRYLCYAGMRNDSLALKEVILEIQSW